MTSGWTRRSATIGAVLAAGAAGRAVAQTPVAPGAPRVAVTRHEGTFNGQLVEYTATVAETFVPNAAGPPAASVVTNA
jgi:hypothetical protein